MGTREPGRPLARPVPRGALFAALDRRAWLTTLVAGPGAGKTTVLVTWSAAHPDTAYRQLRPEDAALPVLLRGIAAGLAAARVQLPAAVADALTDPGLGNDDERAVGLASIVAAALDAPADVDRVLILDGLDNLPADGASVRFVEALSRHAPSGLRLVLASRQPVPFPVDRLRTAGMLTELGIRDLTFAEDETYQALAGAFGDAAAADALAPDLHLVTSGWPALVTLAAGWLAGGDTAERPARLGQLTTTVGPLVQYLVSTLLAALDPDRRELVRHAAHLPAVDAMLAGALGLSEHVEATPPFLEPVPLAPGWYAVPPGQREIVLANLPLADHARGALLRLAVTVYAERGRVGEALAAARALADPALTGHLLAAYGPVLIAAGRAAEVVEEAAKVPAPARTNALDLVEGEARHLCGDVAGALACFERVAAGDAEVPAGVAHRTGNIHHLAGDLDAALAVYGRGRLRAESTVDEAILLAHLADVHWLRGDGVRCRDFASRALAAADRSQDDRAKAAAHNAMANAAEGDGDWVGNAEHTAAALDAAVRAGDLLSQLRTRIVRSQRKLEQARFADALAELDESMRLVEATGSGERRALVLLNRGWAYRGLGRLDEAVAELEAAREVWHDAGSELEAYAQRSLGEVYLVRGDLPAAEAALSAATESAMRTGDVRSLSALAALSRVRYATDPDAAEALASRALDANTGPWRVWALLSAGWIALQRGSVDLAARHADAASEVVMRRRNLSALAEECELRAFLTADGTRRLRLLREAQAQYARIGNPILVARTLAAQAVVADDPDALAAAEGRLRALGVRPEAALAAGPLRLAGVFSVALMGMCAAPATFDRFRARVRAGMDRLARGDLAAASTLVAEAVDHCPGDADGRRGCCVDAMRELAAAASARGAADVALRWYLRMLEENPDEEEGHLGAVGALMLAGRRTEARLRYRLYLERMRAQGAEPAPFPAS
jgi:ATP/maltotriose-dependent transcriptional regulator MalT